MQSESTPRPGGVNYGDLSKIRVPSAEMESGLELLDFGVSATPRQDHVCPGVEDRWPGFTVGHRGSQLAC